MRTCRVKSGSLWWMSRMLAACALPSLAYAHVGVSQASGFAHDFVHPLTGLDYIAAMVAVGFRVAQRGSHVIRVLPLTFVSVMSVSSLLARQLGSARVVRYLSTRGKTGHAGY
jgi:hydrogenase/urease accessory protein HupE